MLNKKVVVVTGGAGLIGRQIVSAIKDNNGIPVIAEIDISRANDVAEKNNCDAIKVDITSERSVKNLITSVYDKYGRVDAVINNAYPRNKNYGNKLEDVKYDDFCENVNTHLGGYFLVSQQFMIFYKKQGYGNIINMSSIYGVRAPKFEIYEGTDMTMPVEYSAIKSGLLHLTRYFAKYSKGCNIRCNAISIGGIYDNQDEKFLKAYKQGTINKGMLDPTDITGSVVFLLSENSMYINGQNIIIDDGWSL